MSVYPHRRAELPDQNEIQKIQKQMIEEKAEFEKI